jgi:hypothetical protein
MKFLGGPPLEKPMRSSNSSSGSGVLLCRAPDRARPSGRRAADALITMLLNGGYGYEDDRTQPIQALDLRFRRLLISTEQNTAA